MHLKSKIEETEQWKEYMVLSDTERKKEEGVRLISSALVQAYVHIDEDLRGLKECGIMVSSQSIVLPLCLIHEHVSG